MQTALNLRVKAKTDFIEKLSGTFKSGEGYPLQSSKYFSYSLGIRYNNVFAENANADDIFILCV
jgi:hypothetical protein